MTQKRTPTGVADTHSSEQGCSDEMRNLYADGRGPLVRYISRYFRRSQEAEDVVQEAFVKVIEAQRDREIRAPKAYLYQTARNLALAELNKKSYRLTDVMGEILPESDLLLSASMENQFEDRENFEIFCRAVRSLPVKCRRAFVLCRIYGFSQKEVAAHMGVTLKAVEGHLTRATRRCIEYVEAEQSNSKSSNTAQGEGRSHG